MTMCHHLYLAVRSPPMAANSFLYCIPLNSKQVHRVHKAIRVADILDRLCPRSLQCQLRGRWILFLVRWSLLRSSEWHLSPDRMQRSLDAQIHRTSRMVPNRGDPAFCHMRHNNYGRSEHLYLVLIKTWRRSDWCSGIPLSCEGESEIVTVDPEELAKEIYAQQTVGSELGSCTPHTWPDMWIVVLYKCIFHCISLSLNILENSQCADLSTSSRAVTYYLRLSFEFWV